MRNEPFAAEPSPHRPARRRERFRRSIRAFLVGFAALSAMGCAGVIRTLPRQPEKPLATLGVVRAWRVGKARVDITPPPGPTTFGHGPDAMASQGYWTRLHCRVFAFESIETGAQTERFVIVPCDLPAISYALFRDVAARVSASSHLPAAHLLLAATHTHAGPAHYFEAPGYSGTLSTRHPGFDDHMLTMIASRIARGIDEALAHPVPAEALWTSKPAMWEISRNRNLETFALNGQPLQGPPGFSCPAGEVIPLAQEDVVSKDGPCRNFPRACRAVDPTVQVLELREVGGRPIGLISFLAMHPTVLPAHSRLWAGDVFGIASRELEHRMRSEWAAGLRSSAESPDSDPLAAIVNTNEGDMVPIWSVGDREETMSVGRRLADAVASTRGGSEPFSPRWVLDATTIEVKMDEAARQLELDSARPALLGQASSHGSNDHRSTVDDLLPRTADWDQRGGAQGPKAPLLDRLQTGVLGPDVAIIGADGFPSQLPFGTWHIGNRWIAALPAELTYTAGWRVRKALGHATGDTNPEHQILAGLANAYIQYVTTCEEYGMQRYEGASNLYGAAALSYVTRVQAWLGCQLAGKSDCGAPPPGKQTGFTDFAIKPDADRTGERFPQPAPLPARAPRLVDVCRLTSAIPKMSGAETSGPLPRFCFRWADASPGSLPFASLGRSPGPWLRVRKAESANDLRWDPRDPRSFVDDWGSSFEVRAHTQCRDDTWGYSALFQPTSEEWEGIVRAAAGNGLGLALVDGHGERIRFPFAETTRACRRDEELFCSWEFDTPQTPLSLACGGER